MGRERTSIVISFPCTVIPSSRPKPKKGSLKIGLLNGLFLRLETRTRIAVLKLSLCSPAIAAVRPMDQEKTLYVLPFLKAFLLWLGWRSSVMEKLSPFLTGACSIWVTGKPFQRNSCTVAGTVSPSKRKGLEVSNSMKAASLRSCSSFFPFHGV